MAGRILLFKIELPVKPVGRHRRRPGKSCTGGRPLPLFERALFAVTTIS